MGAAFYHSDLLREAGPFFRVLATTERSQTAIMTVPPGAAAGPPETHPDADQVFYVVAGAAEFHAWTRGTGAEPEAWRGGAGTLVVVPAGMQHGVKSIGKEPLFFLTVYAPPEYRGPKMEQR